MANFIEATGSAAAQAGWCLFREGYNLVVVPQRRGGMYKWSKGKLIQYSPNVMDVAADDWQVGPLNAVLDHLGLGEVEAGQE